MKVIPNKKAFAGKLPTSKSLDFRRRRKRPDVKNIRKIIILMLETGAVVLLAYLIVRAFCMQVVMTEESMEPQIKVSDRLLIDKVIYRIKDPKQGDVVAFSSPGDLSGRYSVKRVIAVPGQKVLIKNGVVYVDDKVYQAPAQTTTIKDSGLASSEFTLGGDEYFLLGDNRDVSEDSRYTSVGNILKSQIRGKIWLDASFRDFGVVD
ncbi:signal peptidase I [Candidatus Weimeria sp. HCP3S3_B5]|uniref:signal peptidase I n=1 Tax=Candidatus Weimeria sp. HCP3S3_B5 TaxID=3438871 RepID=UPI0030249B0F|nr:signal peptidase I [Lachnospiraceae bacterium]